MQAAAQSLITLQYEFLRRPDFWISLIIDLAGLIVGIFALVYAIRAFNEATLAKGEAEKAKDAATEAGKTVRAQSVAIELGEIPTKLGRLQPDTEFSQARELLNEISWRTRRAISPFSEELPLKAVIEAIRKALDTAQTSLNNLRPASGQAEVPGVIYNGLESDFAVIGNLIADLLGLLDKRTIDPPGVRYVKP